MKGFFAVSMIVIVFIVFLFFLTFGPSMVSHFGWSERNSELTGQVKKVIQTTPLMCPDRNYIDVSLGVMNNGTGSMSTHDVELWVPNDQLISVLQQASKTGKILTFHYDTMRIGYFCTGTDLVLTSIDQ